MLKFAIFILFYSSLVPSKADYCQDNFTLAELPGGIQGEAISLILSGAIIGFKGCNANNSGASLSDLKFFLYNRANPEEPILLDPTNPVQLDSSKPIKMLLPGWLCNVTNERMPELRRAYLKRYDCSVIGLDWTAKSIDLFSNSYCSLPAIAKIVANFLCFLNETLHVDLDKALHILGHSLGGQLAGLIGQYVQKQCKQKIGRITGLDPAGAMFQYALASDRLSALNAALVDVIHTDQGKLGYSGPCGSADFFPNCGYYQPGCININSSTTAQDIINLPLSSLTCNHIRSCDYMIESINAGSNSFSSTSCEECPGVPLLGPCINDIFFPSHTVMGENCPRNPPARKFHLLTNSKSPFSRS